MDGVELRITAVPMADRTHNLSQIVLRSLWEWECKYIKYDSGAATIFKFPYDGHVDRQFASARSLFVSHEVYLFDVLICS